MPVPKEVETSSSETTDEEGLDDVDSSSGCTALSRVNSKSMYVIIMLYLYPIWSIELFALNSSMTN